MKSNFTPQGGSANQLIINAMEKGQRATADALLYETLASVNGGISSDVLESGICPDGGGGEVPHGEKSLF